MRFAWRIRRLSVMLALAWTTGARAQSLRDQLRAALERGLADERVPVNLAGLPKPTGSLWSRTRAFYAQRDYWPAWTQTDGADARIRDLLARLELAADQGLDSSEYPIRSVRALTTGHARTMDPDSLARLDIIATIGFLHYGTDLAIGRVFPPAADTMWGSAARDVDVVARLAGALDSDRVGSTLEELPPPQGEAARLRGALARYRDIAAQGGWPELPAGPLLALGAGGPRVELLRRRLQVTGDLALGGVSELFDTVLEAAVRHAQARHGLDTSGTVERATLAALNVPVAARIRQLETNLERWRWVPRDLGRRYVMVNTAGFTLAFVDSGRTVLSSRVVAGRVDRPTPIVSGLLTDVTFNPRWNIPRSIAVHEILPAARHDAAYLAREGIHVLSDTTADAVELDATTIPWGSVADSTFGYRLWQAPGPRNPLGRIRFTILNRFGVALHDTPASQLFGPLARAFSHGCVRVADAEQLAVHVLRGLPGWTADSVRAAVSLSHDRRVPVPEPLAVHFAYWTGWVTDDGTVEFRPDVYGWDAKLAKALRRARLRAP